MAANTRMPKHTIACFGEALWDILPRGLFLGGAPLNVAYHLSCLGVTALPITAVGEDFLGDELVRRIEGWGLESKFVRRRRRDATGTVRATLDANGVATYTIAEPVAWDRIAVSPELLRADEPAAIVFGTLALRNAENRRALEKIFRVWPSALRVLDLNFRRPFDRGVGVKFALAHAQFVKLNDEELARVRRTRVSTRAEMESAARRFASEHQIQQVCVTAGRRGAGLLWDGDWHWEAGRRIAVRDTVGAGDAFLAAFLAACFHRRESPRRALAAACRLGEFIAARDGATPPYRCDERGRPHE